MPPRGLPPMVSCLVDDELEASGPPRAHFRRDHAAEFPALARAHPTTFARQAANPRWAKRRVLARLAGPPGGGGARLVDSPPMPACRFARARRRFAGSVAWGLDPVAAKAFHRSRPTRPRRRSSGTWSPRRRGWARATASTGARPCTRPSRRPAACCWPPSRGRGATRAGAGSPRLRQRIEHTLGRLVERLDCRRIRLRGL